MYIYIYINISHIILLGSGKLSCIFVNVDEISDEILKNAHTVHMTTEHFMLLWTHCSTCLNTI